MLGTMWSMEWGGGWGVRTYPFLENSNLLNTNHTVQIHVLETATNQLESKVTHVSHVASSNCHPTRGGRGGFRSFQLRACLVHCQFFYDETLMSNEFKYVVDDVMVIENAEH